MTTTYQQIEETAQTGDLLFFSGRRFWSYFIRFWSCSHWSHVGFAYKDESGCLCVVESVEGHGVRCVPFAVWSTWKGDILVKRARMLVYQEISEQAALGALNYIGSRYASPFQFVRSFSLLWSKLSWRIGVSPDQDKTKFFCSELVAQELSLRGMSFKKHPARMKPGDLEHVAEFEEILRFDYDKANRRSS